MVSPAGVSSKIGAVALDCPHALRNPRTPVRSARVCLVCTGRNVMAWPGTTGAPALSSANGERLFRLLQQLFEKVECAGVVALAEPEQSGFPQLGIGIGFHHVNQSGHTLRGISLGECKHRLFSNLPIGAVVVYD